MKRFVPVTLMLMAALAGCTETKTRTEIFCPTLNDQGPGLSPTNNYLLTVSSLSEEWTAARREGSSLTPLTERGLAGRAPNDMDVAGDHLYVVNSGDNTVSVVDLRDGKTVGCIETGVGTNPWELLVDPADSTKAWLTAFLTGELLELDLEDRRVLRRKTIGPALEGLWITEAQVAVTLTGFQGTEGTFSNGTVVVLDRITLEETHRHPVPPNPQSIFQGADGRFHVICTGNFNQGPTGEPGRVVRIEADWSAVRDTLVLGGSPSRGVLASDGTAYVAAFYGGVMVYDTVTLTVRNPILGDPGFTSVVLGGGLLYAANFDLDAVAIIDIATGAVVGDLLVGDGPVALALYSPAP